ncbi:probable inactive receptor kinase [Tanacetum coccineum]
MMTSSSLLFIFLLLLITTTTSLADLTQDTTSLTSFITKIPHAPRITWNTSLPTCSWTGVTCDDTNSSVVHLRLPAAGLVGPIPPSSIGMMTSLRVLSLHSNALTEIPDDFANLKLLRNLYLHGNKFTGDLPASLLTELTRLVRVDLSDNGFSGEIPFGVNNLTQLNGLFLQGNKLSGKLPSNVPTSLSEFNVSDNNLNGSIPSSLGARFPANAFSGNINLCGSPLPPCNGSFFPGPAPSPDSQDSPSNVSRKNKKKLSTGAIVAIVVGSVREGNGEEGGVTGGGCGPRGGVGGAAARRERGGGGLGGMEGERIGRGEEKERGRGGGGVGRSGSRLRKNKRRQFVNWPPSRLGRKEGERNKLVFFEGGVYSFDLEDLLRASAEVLGKGSVGTSYKAVLEEGTTVVVKRLKDVVVTKKEFDSVMEGLGKMKNENVVPIRAYYFSKDEKLLVCDYFPAGSLSSLLHGSRGSGRTPLDWDHRLRIALSAARGVAYLHVAGKVVHGNIKSSNILLRQDSNKDASVSDFGLNTLFGGSSTPNTRVTGYRAPEVLETRKATFKSDVYSFGVLLLELLTGKAPNQASLGEEGIDLPRWVQSVVREEWTAEVFDVELMRYQNIEEEMVQLLQIAMACVSTVPDQRPAMQEVVRMMEDMNRAETDDGMRQSSDDPSKGSDGHTPPTESRNSPNTVTP